MPPQASEAVLNYASHLSSLILGTLIVCLVKILYKLDFVQSKDGAIGAGPFSIRVERFWIVPVGATVLHVLLSHYFVQACNQIKDEAIRAVTAYALSDGDPLLFGGLSPMKKWLELPLLGDIYIISSMLTRVLFYSWIILVFMSLYQPKDKATWRSYLMINSPIILLCIVNWIIGGKWFIAASNLSR